MPRFDRLEIAIFVQLSLLVFWFGVYTSTLLDIMDASVSTLLSQLNGSVLSASLR